MVRQKRHEAVPLCAESAQTTEEIATPATAAINPNVNNAPTILRANDTPGSPSSFGCTAGSAHTRPAARTARQTTAAAGELIGVGDGVDMATSRCGVLRQRPRNGASPTPYDTRVHGRQRVAAEAR